MTSMTWSTLNCLRTMEFGTTCGRARCTKVKVQEFFCELISTNETWCTCRNITKLHRSSVHKVKVLSNQCNWDLPNYQIHPPFQHKTVKLNSSFLPFPWILLGWKRSFPLSSRDTVFLYSVCISPIHAIFLELATRLFRNHFRILFLRQSFTQRNFSIMFLDKLLCSCRVLCMKYIWKQHILVTVK